MRSVKIPSWEVNALAVVNHLKTEVCSDLSLCKTRVIHVSVIIYSFFVQPGSERLTRASVPIIEKKISDNRVTSIRWSGRGSESK